MGIGSLRRLDDLLIRTFQAPVGDVVPDRIIKENRLLGNQANLLS